MSHSDSTPRRSPEAQRVPLEREVILEFEHFSSFIREYSANLSRGGMFIKSDQPLLRESLFRFEVRLVDDGPLITGLAKVLWVRETAEDDDRPSGMGVRFLKLEEAGRELIDQIVREHEARGGQPFSLEDGLDADQPAGGPAGAEPAAGPSAPQPMPEVEAPPTEASSTSPPAPPPARPESPVDDATVPMDRSTVIPLPALDDLLEEARSPGAGPSMDQPPRGWKPGIRVARPETRPQLIAVIAVALAVIGGLIFLGIRMFNSEPVLDATETEPVELPRAEDSAEAEEAPPPPFTAVEEISWRRAGRGVEVIVRLDGSIDAGTWQVDRISDPPRHLLRLLGVGRPYPAETYEVGSGGVRQVRTGYHDTGAGNEQHVVIDLVDPRVVLEETAVDGTAITLSFRPLS